MLPEEFVKNMKELLNEESDSFFNSLERDEVKALTVDINKISKKEFEKVVDFDINEIEYMDNAYYYKGKIGIKNLRFGGIVTDIIADEKICMVESNEGYTLKINGYN